MKQMRKDKNNLKKSCDKKQLFFGWNKKIFERKLALLSILCYDKKVKFMPEWRNWQTHMTQNHAGNHVGSSPTFGTKKTAYPFESQRDMLFFDWICFFVSRFIQ